MKTYTILSNPFIRIALVTAAVLLIPFLAMQLSSEVNWSLFDFAVIGALVIGIGLAYEAATRLVKNSTHQAIVGIVLLALLFLIWAELGVGIFGTPLAGS